MTPDDGLHGSGGEILTVDPQPLVGPAGEVQPAVVVAVGEIAGPVAAITEAGAGRLLIAVITLESACGLGLDDLANRLLETRRASVGAEGNWRALLACLGVQELHRGAGRPGGASRHRPLAAAVYDPP